MIAPVRKPTPSAVSQRRAHGWCDVHARTIPPRGEPPAACADCRRRPITARAPREPAAEGLSAITIAARVAAGWSAEAARSMPLQRRGAPRGRFATPAPVLARRKALGLNANMVAQRVALGWFRWEAELIANGQPRPCEVDAPAWVQELSDPDEVSRKTG
jgi:hypothetical protein